MRACANKLCSGDAFRKTILSLAPSSEGREEAAETKRGENKSPTVQISSGVSLASESRNLSHFFCLLKHTVIYDYIAEKYTRVQSPSRAPSQRLDEKLWSFSQLQICKHHWTSTTLVYRICILLNFSISFVLLMKNLSLLNFFFMLSTHTMILFPT